MPWNITLKCQHRYQLPDPPDLSRPLVCGITRPGQDKTDGLQMIIAAKDALYELAEAHNALAAERRQRDAKAARDRSRRARRAAVARGEAAPDAVH